MAVGTNYYFSNAFTGPAGGGDFNIFDTHANARYAVGTKVCRQDGNEYVYSHFGDAVTAGAMCSTDLDESSLLDVDVVAPGTSASGTDGNAGTKFIQITETATADQFAGGYISIEDDAGEGHLYRIKGNTATGDPASGDARIELYDAIVVTLTTDSTANIQGSLYANLEAATTTDIAAAGVAVRAQSADQFGWIQVAGVASVLTSGTQVIGSGTTLAAAGALAPESEAAILASPATTIAVGATGEQSIVKLTLG